MDELPINYLGIVKIYVTCSWNDVYYARRHWQIEVDISNQLADCNELFKSIASVWDISPNQKKIFCVERAHF